MCAHEGKHLAPLLLPQQARPASSSNTALCRLPYCHACAVPASDHAQLSDTSKAQTQGISGPVLLSTLKKTLNPKP